MGEPGRYPRRVAVVLSGLSPQVVTETLYALAVEQRWRFIPTEVHLLTTREGAQRARLTLLSREPGYFRRLCREYGLGRIRFGNDSIHEFRDSAGRALEDVRTEEDNRCAANQVVEWIRSFTEDDGASVHVSLAGGRKALGFYAGYALSLLGREQDRLSHVLVTPQFESHPEFFYPPKESRILYTAPPDSRPMDAKEAKVELAFIPFVRLRPHLPQSLLSSRLTYESAVEAADAALSAGGVRIRFSRGRIEAEGIEVRMPPADLAFLRWIARRGGSGVECPAEGAPDTELAREYLAEYARCGAGETDRKRTEGALRGGMEKGFFLERKSRVNRAFRRALGPKSALVEVTGMGKRPRTRHRVGVEASRIVIEEGER